MRIIHGRAEDVLVSLETDPARTVIITDPVWPNAPAGLFGISDPDALFASCARHFGRLARRVVIVLGIASDPRFLRHIPAEMPFVRVCWLRLACPSYMGTILNSGDVAYVFGSREAGQGFTVMSGETTATEAGRAVDWHPTPRKYEHMLWLVKQFTRDGDTVLDPFCGSGTTLAAARTCGRHAVGVEASAEFVSLAEDRLLGGGPLFAPPPR